MTELVYFHDKTLVMIVFIGCVVGVLMCLFAFGEGFSGLYLESKGLEILWTVLPALRLVLLALPSLYLLFYLESPSAVTPSERVKAIGHQWYWEYDQLNPQGHYQFDRYMVDSSESPGVFSNFEVDLPTFVGVNKYIRFVATAADVLHRFAIPSLGVKLDSIPGRLNQQFIYTVGLGVFYGQCSEICGANHRFMPIRVEVGMPNE